MLKVRPVITEQALAARPYANLRAFCALLGEASSEARLLELDGVIASVVPAVPDRSIANSVMYERAEAL
jgi:hypothetical protein